MGEIDKSLPNVKQEVNIDPQEIEQALVEDQVDVQKEGAPVDVQENEDGSVDINFDPGLGSQPQSEDHFANLAELLEVRQVQPTLS
jgi:hypothetical protein